MTTRLPDINSNGGRAVAAGGAPRSKTAMGGPPPTGPPPGPRSETSMGMNSGQPAPLQPTGVHWLDDMQHQLQAEAQEAAKVGMQPGMHSGFATKFSIPQSQEQQAGEKGGSPPTSGRAGIVALRGGDTSPARRRGKQQVQRRAGRPVHVAYAPEVTASAAGTTGQDQKQVRGQMGLRDYQLLAEACQRAGRAKTEANAYYKMGELCSSSRESLPRAVKFFERYLNLSRRLKDTQGVAKALNCLGIVHQEMGAAKDLEAALQYHQAHCQVADIAGLFVAHTNLGLVHALSGSWDRSLESHRSAMQYALRSGDKQAEALALANLGLVGRAQQDFTTAQVCLERHLELAQALQDSDAERDAYEQLGHLLSDKGDWETADRFFASARQLTDTHTQSDPNPAMQRKSQKLKCKLGFVRASAAMERHFREVAERMGSRHQREWEALQ